MKYDNTMINDEGVGDVWELETPAQDWASDTINMMYEDARKGSVGKRNFLKRLYEDNWDTIKNRMEAEGSIWYVWYMDGVNKLLADEAMM